MGRVSQAQAEDNRRRVVETASRLFREQGTHVSVADLMKASGLTHGGFYKQFASKEALIDEATAHAFDELAQHHKDGLEQYAGQRDAAQRALIDAYLSVEHRDSAQTGAPPPHSPPTWRANAWRPRGPPCLHPGSGRLRRLARHRGPGRPHPAVHHGRRTRPVPGHQGLPALRGDPHRRARGADGHQLTRDTVRGGTPHEGHVFSAPCRHPLLVNGSPGLPLASARPIFLDRLQA